MSTQDKIDFAPGLSVTELAQKLIDSGRISNVVGCSEEDIIKLERRNNLTLPSTYKEFLRIMGRRADGHWDWVGSWEYSSLSWMKQQAAHCYVDERELFFGDVVAKQNRVPPSLPRTAHIFMCNLPDFYMFFDTAEGDDPPCYRIYEYAPFERQFDSFSTFFADSVQKQLAQKDTEKVEQFPSGDNSSAAADGVVMFSETRPRKAMTVNGAPVKVTWAYDNQVERWANVLHRSLLFQLEQYGVIRRENVAGCSEQEITSLEERFEVDLPYVYKIFLQHMGKGADVLLSDCQWRLDDLAGVRQTALDMVAHARQTHTSAGGFQFELAPTDFVFLARQSDLFLYFDTTQEDLNPAVYRFWSGAKEPVLATEKFSDWVKTYESDGHRLRLQCSYVWHQLDTQSTGVRQTIVDGRPVENPTTADGPPPKNSGDNSQGATRFVAYISSAVIGLFAILALAAGKSVPTVLAEIGTSVIFTSVLLTLFAMRLLPVARENQPTNEAAFLRYDLRRQNGYTRTRALLTATLDGITSSYLGDDKVGTTIQFVWNPNSDGVIDGTNLKFQMDGLLGNSTLTIPREHLAEWEGEWIKMARGCRNIKRSSDGDVVAANQWSVSTSFSNKNPPPTHRNGVAFETWRSTILRPFAVCAMCIGMLSFVVGTIAGPLFAGNGLVPWTRLPGGWFVILPIVGLSGWIASLTTRARKTQPVKCVTDFSNDQIRVKAWAQTGAYMHSRIPWNWNWELHIREEGVRLFSPERCFVIVVANEPIPLGKLLLIKEQVVKHGGTVHQRTTK